jgi:Sulfotransferase family
MSRTTDLPTGGASGVPGAGPGGWDSRAGRAVAREAGAGVLAARFGLARAGRRILRRIPGRQAAPGTTLPAWTGPSTTRRPIFVGGTGRSGTTITARLLDVHPAYRMVPIEVRFISDDGGLCDLLEDRVTFSRFRHRLIARWFDRGAQRGLHLITDRKTLRAATRELAAGFETDRWQAAARFVHRVLDPATVEAGAEGWIEMTPGNVHVASTLLRIFPDMRLVHSVRDGRDVACSVTPLGWGPSDLQGALDWWAASLERAFRATDELPANRLVVVQLEALVAHARDAEYARLITGVGLEDDPAMRSYFDREITPERAHLGRWRQDVPAEDRRAFGERYAALASGIRQRGDAYDTGGDIDLAAGGVTR